MNRSVVAVLLATVTLAMPAAVASADSKTEPLWLECEGVPSGWITANGNGSWTPGLASGGTGVYVPYAFDFEFWFTPDGDEEYLVGQDSVSKRAPKNKHPRGTCTFEDTEVIVDDPELGTGIGRFVGTAWVFYTG